MSYVDHNLRFVLDETSIKPLRRRSEGRLKTYDSSEDLRSWNYTVNDRRQQILDVVKSDIEKCGKLSTAVLHALCQRSKAELARNLKKLWDFLMSRNLTPEEKEQLQELQTQMGYVCMQAIKDCTCIGDYELVCVCDDESGSKHKNRLLNVVQTLEQKLNSKEPFFQDNLSKENKPCSCTASSSNKIAPYSGRLAGAHARSLRPGTITTSGYSSGPSSTYGPGYNQGVTFGYGSGLTSRSRPCPSICLGYKGKDKPTTISEVAMKAKSSIGERPTVSDDTMRQGASSYEIKKKPYPDRSSGKDKPTTISEVAMKAKSPIGERPTVSDDTMRQGASSYEIKKKPYPDRSLGSKIKSKCHPSCVRFKANVTRPTSADKNEGFKVSTAEQAVRSAVSTANIVCQCDMGPSKRAALTTDPTELSRADKRIERSKPTCKCSDKATSTYPSPQKSTRSVKVGVQLQGMDQSSEAYRNMQNKLKALECLCEEQQNNIENMKSERDDFEKKYQESTSAMTKPTDCTQDMEEFERELSSLNRGIISPEMEASVIKRELDILKKYCLKLKAAEEENEKLKKEQNELKRLGKPRLRGTVSSGGGVSTFEEGKDCENCAILSNKVKMLERRLAKCTNTQPEDFEIYKNRTALIDTTLAERDEMQKKIEQMDELQAQLNEYKKRAARADELEGQLRMLQKEKASSYDVKRIQSRCSCVERELQNVRAERDAVHKRLDLMKDEMECLRAKAKEAEVLLVERDKLQIKLNDLSHVQVHNENLRLKCKCLENSANERDMYKQKFEQLLGMETQNDALKAQLEASVGIKRERDCLKKQVADLQSCIIDQENEIKRLMQQIDSLIKNKDDIQSRMKDALASMRAEIEKKDQLIASADNKLYKMQSELKSSIQGVSCETSCYKTRIEELENELNEAKIQISQLERTSKERQDNVRKHKACEFEAICSMKKELQAANTENKKLQEIANNMAILTGDEHVQKMLRQSECAVRKVVEELSKQYREWDNLKKDRRRSKSGSSSQIYSHKMREEDEIGNKMKKDGTPSNKTCPGELIALKLENARKKSLENNK